MFWIIIGGYIACHFLLFLGISRWPGFLWSERGIFLFHFASVLLVAAGLPVLGFFGIGAASLARVIGAGALHGIYSLTVIEVWLLSEGGYTLRILGELARRGSLEAEMLTQAFVDVSARKKRGRLDSLASAGLVRSAGNTVELTRRGRIVADVIMGIAALVAFRVKQ